MTENVVREKHQSIFDRIWIEVEDETHGEVTVQDLNRLVSHLETVLDQQPSRHLATASGIFSNDTLMKARISQFINAMGSSARITRSQALEYLSSVIDEGEILGFQDYSGYKINNPNESRSAIVDSPDQGDNFHNLLHKASSSMRMLAGSPSIRSQKSEDTDFDTDDYDETASLMGTSPYKQFHHRSPSLDEPDPIGSENQQDNSPQTFIRKSLEDLHKFHDTLDGNFESMSKEISDVEEKNVQDFEKLSTIKVTNDMVLERLGTLKSELKEISSHIDTHKKLQSTPPVTPKKSVTRSNSPSTKVNITSTVMNERDKAVFEKLTLKWHSSFIYSGYGKKRVLSEGQPSGYNVGVSLDFKHPISHRRAASEVHDSQDKSPRNPKENAVEAASNQKDSITFTTRIEKEKGTIQKDLLLVADDNIKMETITPKQEEFSEDSKAPSNRVQIVPEKFNIEPVPETKETSESGSGSNPETTLPFTTQEALRPFHSTQTVTSETSTSNFTLFIFIFSLLLLILSYLWQ